MARYTWGRRTVSRCLVCCIRSTSAPGPKTCVILSYAGAVKQSQAERELASFIAKFSPEIGALARSILAAMRERYPTAIQLVYDNYNALAIGFGPSERAS